MESTAETTLRDEPQNGVTGGIDWARDDHPVLMCKRRGPRVRRAIINHNPPELPDLLRLRNRAQVNGGAH
ncbi:Putative transposase fragment [Mycobacterium canettii CIPT 140060008]|nr:Putative transposase fragment [Mycobacterium canettii CIPT 140060008]